MNKWVGATLASLVLCGTVQAGDYWVHVNGGSYHPQHRGEFRETHPGIGFTAEFGSTIYTADVFKDSNGDTSGHVGYGKRAGWRYLQGELVVGVMHRRDVQARTGAALFPYALPFITVGNEEQRMRFGYVPRTNLTPVPVFTWQYMARW